MRIRPDYSLSPLHGKLNKRQILHLFRRTVFGLSQNDLRFLEDKSLEEYMQILLKPSPPAAVPVQEISDYNDPLVPLGETWIDAPYENDTIQNCRDFFLKGWWLGNIVNRDYSITEKMTVFWHNHFVVEMAMVKDARYSYRYVAMLRKHALGNFKELIKEGSTNIAMLVYLNGNYNTKEAPNENYARELLELFTVGKGYAENYTEDDVREAARVLTGYTDDKETIQVKFQAELHDTGDKKFSAFFDHHVIKGQSGEAGKKELDELIEMIFRKKETALFFCRNLYRWFVSHHIDDEVEQKIIVPLSEIFIAANFEVQPVLETLLSSKHFFDPVFQGCIIKSPVEYFMGTFHEFDVINISRVHSDHQCWWGSYLSIGSLGMYLGEPPSVAGWPAYYQAPKFHRWWANAALLELRKKVVEGLSSEEGLVLNCPPVKYNFLPFAQKVENVENVNEFVKNCLAVLVSVDVSKTTVDNLTEILLSGLAGNMYWTEMWETYLKNPTDAQAINVIENRLRPFFRKIMQLPEYQMM